MAVEAGLLKDAHSCDLDWSQCKSRHLGIDCPLFSDLRGEFIDNYVRLTNLQKVLEASVEYRQAVELMAPLYAELTSVQAQLQSEEQAKAQAEANLSKAVREAEAAALERAEKDPVVLAAKKAVVELAGK
jgi:hypothetical protein